MGKMLRALKAFNRHRSAEGYYPLAAQRPRNRRHGSSYSASPPRSRRADSRWGGGRRDRSTGDRGRGSGDHRRFEHAATTALEAAVVETMRVRKEPGSWTGSKGRRVATAALGAAAVDALVAADKPYKHAMLKTVEGAVGGLVVNRVVNVPKKELRERSRGRG